MKPLVYKRLILFLFFTLSGMVLISQSEENIVHNSDFESGGHPNAWSQMNLCDYWETLLEGTADYYENGHYEGNIAAGPNILCDGGGFMQAHSGDKFVGFGPCEGAYTELATTITACESFKISFWFSPRCYNLNDNINVYLLEEPINNFTFDDCNNPQGTIDAFHFQVPVNSDNTNNVIHTPGIWYYYESDLVELVGDQVATLTGMFIKGPETFSDPYIHGTFHSNDYVYVDDVQVIKYDVCNYECPFSSELSVTDADDVTYTNSTALPYQLGMKPNEYPLAYFRLNNAVEYKFYIFDPENQGVVYQDTKRICSEYYVPCWNGQSTGSNILDLQGNTYTCSLWRRSTFI